MKSIAIPLHQRYQEHLGSIGVSHGSNDSNSSIDSSTSGTNTINTPTSSSTTGTNLLTESNAILPTTAPSPVLLPKLTALDDETAFQELRFTHDAPTAVTISNHTQLFQRLGQQHPTIFHFAQGGREMMDTFLREQKQQNNSGGSTNSTADNKSPWVTILEIGVWFGYSTSRWLQVAPYVRVIGVDPFRSPSRTHKKLQAVAEADRALFGQPWFNKALTHHLIDQQNISNGRNRTVLVTGYYPGAVESLLQPKQQRNEQQKLSSAITIDLFYIDGGKSSDPVGHCNFVNETIVGMLKAFPDAVIAGDDWKFVSYGDPAPFQQTVIRLSRLYKRSLYVAGQRTWIMANGLSPKVTQLGKKLV